MTPHKEVAQTSVTFYTRSLYTQLIHKNFVLTLPLICKYSCTHVHI